MTTLDFMERVCRSAGEILRKRFGRIDAFIDFGCQMEGHAAAGLIAERAGAVLRKYDSTAWDRRTKGIVVNAPGIDEELHGVRS